jgi:uncharacterized protein (TIGR02246 family)
VQNPDRTQLLILYRELIGAWNDQDAKGMASLYTSQGIQIGFDGSTIIGPKAIVKHLATIFRKHPTPKFVFIVRKTRLLGADYGLVQATAGMVPRNGLSIDASKNVIQMMLASRKKSNWKIDLFQNTPAKFDGRPDDVQELTTELQAKVTAQLG